MIVLKTQLETLEAMDFFWAALKDREKIADLFIQEVTTMDGFRLSYDEEFTSESVRRVLSALSNHEPFRATNKKEGRFYSNNLWMMDDLGIEKAMLHPAKQLNLDNVREKISKEIPYEQVIVHFVPLHLENHRVVKNNLLLNFFKIQLSDEDDSVTFQGEKLEDYICNVINQEMK